MPTVTNNIAPSGMLAGSVPFVNNETVPVTITFGDTAGAADVVEVPISVLDGNGDLVAQPHVLLVWLSDAATGAGLTATTASGTVTAKSASGAVLGTLTAKKALVVQTLATGVFTLEITDTANTTFRVCAQNPYSGEVFVSDELVEYGS